jgi:hypothetical protein
MPLEIKHKWRFFLKQLWLQKERFAFTLATLKLFYENKIQQNTKGLVVLRLG